jgi:DNA-binding transcriptional LysR family regulator
MDTGLGRRDWPFHYSKDAGCGNFHRFVCAFHLGALSLAFYVDATLNLFSFPSICESRKSLVLYLRLRQLRDVPSAAQSLNQKNVGLKPLQPTRAGQETYEFAKPVLNSVNDLKTGIMQGGEPSGDFRFGMTRALGDLAIGSPIRCLRADFPKVRIQAFVQWSGVLLERLANRALDSAVVLLPEGKTPPASLVSECLGIEPFAIVAAKAKRFSQPATLQELPLNPWVLNPHGCGVRQQFEVAFLQRGLPFISAVEAEGYELQLSLISEGVGLGLAMPQVFHSSSLRGQLKLVKAKDFSPRQNVWLLHSRHVGRLAPVVVVYEMRSSNSCTHAHPRILKACWSTTILASNGERHNHRSFRSMPTKTEREI